MKNLLEFLLIHLVDNPEAVSIETSMEGDTEVFTLHVAPEDMGKVIGKQGKVINSIRTLARVRAVKEGKHISVILADEAEGMPQEVASEEAPQEEVPQAE